MNLRENWSKSFASSFMFTLLLMSFATISSYGSQAANGQSNMGCERVPTLGIAASQSVPGDPPSNVLDRTMNTLWTIPRDGDYIQLDLGQPTMLCSLDALWFQGDKRQYSFVVSASLNGQNFQEIVSASSTGQTTSAERYRLPEVSAQYVRVTVLDDGVADEDDNGAIFEMAIQGNRCMNPIVSEVTATGSQGPNVPDNTIDKNPNTRWSNLGRGSWVEYDLGTSQPVCNVDISWYRGNFRENAFTISTSNDGVNYQTVFSGQSDRTLAAQRYDVTDTDAKYVRITVNGNTENNWASITEVAVNSGFEASPPPPPPGNDVEICNNGIDDDGDGQIDSADPDCAQPPPPPGNDVDPFGIMKIYPTKADGEEWFMDMTDGEDPRSRPPELTKNSDDSFKVTSTQVRYGVFTTSGYDQNKIATLDHGEIAEKGYMQSPNDWRDVEITGYVKVNEGQSGENFAWYARGGRHTGGGSPEGCEGSAYKGDLYYDGRVRFAKEQWHVSYDFTDHKRPTGSIEGKWVGLKTIIWNTVENGETVAKMEIWLDINNNGNWVKVDENTDAGGWGNSGRECGGEPDQIITWGGPIATFRWDGASDVDIKNFSVREIQPPS